MTRDHFTDRGLSKRRMRDGCLPTWQVRNYDLCQQNICGRQTQAERTDTDHPALREFNKFLFAFGGSAGTPETIQGATLT